MSYREGAGEANDSPLTDPADIARKAFGGWLFVGSLALGAAFAGATGQSPVTKGLAYQGGGATQLIGMIAVIPVAVFLAWRVRQGKGWIAGSLLLVWWATEVLAKLVGGTLNIGWGLAHLAGMLNLFLGVKACWQIRENKRSIQSQPAVPLG